MKAALFRLIVGLAATVAALSPTQPSTWNRNDLEAIKRLWIGSLKALPPDPSNKYSDDPRAAAFGHKLFFDTSISANGKVACASCHKPERVFTDGLPLAEGVGTANRKTMTIVGTAYSPWLFWDGRKDSQWAQALGPMEDPVEHGGNRTQYAHLIAQRYRLEYEALFGKLPDLSTFPPSAGPVDDKAAKAGWEAMSAADRDSVTRIYANMGKAIAAYERKILPGPGRFDRFAEALIQGNLQAAQSVLSADEIEGLRLFIGESHCTNCHSGPLFTDNDFHNTGIPAAGDRPADRGRGLGAKKVFADEFNCLSIYSDAKPDDCVELKFLKMDDPRLEGAFKPPTLRNVAETGPYMHAGQKKTLKDVLMHYNQAPEAPAGNSELKPLRLSRKELAQLEAFLGTLSGPLNAPAEFLKPPVK